MPDLYIQSTDVLNSYSTKESGADLLRVYLYIHMNKTTERIARWNDVRADIPIPL